MATKLTDISVRNLKPAATRREIPDPGARGLYVIVQPSGRKSYAVRYRLNGKPQKLTLGSVLLADEPKGAKPRENIEEPKIGDALSLAGARKLAAVLQHQLTQGRDPGKTKRQDKEARRIAAENTLKAVAEEYLRRECGLQRNTEGRATFKNGKIRSGAWRCAVLERLVYKEVGDRPITDIRRSEIIRLLDRIEAGELKDKDGDPIKGGPVMADRTLAVVRKIMNWHATRSDDFRSPIVRGMARTKPKERTRSRTLTDHELRAVWKAAGDGKGPFPALVKFLLLTAARRSEAAGLSWAEIDDADWTLPAARNKTKLDLVRPLNEAAQAVLDAQPEIDGCPYVFTTDGRAPLSGFSKFKRDFDKACGVTGWTLHDLRRTARSLMSRAAVNSDHAERCLGHVIGGVRGTYDRHEYYDERKQAFEALAAQIERVVNPPKGNVTEMPKRRKRA